MTQRNPHKEDGHNKSLWHSNLDAVTNAIRQDRRASYYVPLVINGDLTEYGHSTERRDTQRKMHQASANRPGPLILPGLGNHDYDQNVGNCSNNGCARDSVCDLVKWVNTLSPTPFDHRFDTSSNTHRGSLAYSVGVGRVHIVQLNLEPSYTRNFETGGLFAPGMKRRFAINSAMDWLERDLKYAQARGRHVIINLHKRNNWQDDSVRDGRFAKLLEQYNVVAVFAGHYHGSIGKVATIGKVPVFQTGAMLSKSYLRVTFDWSTYKMWVTPVTLGSSPPPGTIVSLKR